MWGIAGGMSNPHFGAGRSNWADDQLRSNPLPVRLLSDAVQYILKKPIATVDWSFQIWNIRKNYSIVGTEAGFMLEADPL